MAAAAPVALPWHEYETLHDELRARLTRLTSPLVPYVDLLSTGEAYANVLSKWKAPLHIAAWRNTSPGRITLYLDVPNDMAVADRDFLAVLGLPEKPPRTLTLEGGGRAVVHVGERAMGLRGDALIRFLLGFRRFTIRGATLRTLASESRAEPGRATITRFVEHAHVWVE